MSYSFEMLRALLNTLPVPIFRDSPPSNVEYPFIVYEFVNERQKRASNRVVYSEPLYQISYVTTGLEVELKPLKQLLDNAQIAYQQFESVPYDENELEITQFYTYVRCINGEQ